MGTKRKQPSYKRPSGYAKRSRTMPGLPSVTARALLYKKVRPEYKVCDSTLSNAQALSAGNIEDLTQNLVRGNTALNNFLGSMIDIVSISVRIQLVAGESSTLIPVGPDTNNMTRFVVFQWLADTVPLLQDIFQYTGGFAPLSPFKQENAEKLNILADRCYSTNLVCFQQTALGTTSSGNAINDKIYIKGRKVAPVSFRNTGVAVSSNDIYMVIVCDSAFAPHPIYTYASRITFID